MSTATGDGSRAHPWVLTAPGGQSGFEAYRDETLDPPTLVVQIGTNPARLRPAPHRGPERDAPGGDWMPLGSADGQKPAADGTVGAWARSADNPVGGWYGLKKGLRGQFGNDVPPVLERLGLAEMQHKPRNDRVRAV